ncbi:MAG: 2,3,4,5-tetrahydropyridine-2,6-dicarboxylate N-succinyltransferase [Calditrichaeota bacterium]|nr:MAG: 2,3,4,5-tetrahydropyridine-2,6-dicarboxylate N-succinyltransferase [Calditrichota bacterium]
MLQQKIEELYNLPASELNDEARIIFEEFKAKVNSGEIRAAEKIGDSWQVNLWVKKGILIGFRLGKLVDLSINENFRFIDKDTFPLKKITLKDKIRQVPGGSSIRDGAFVGQSVTLMPPMYINVGAYVDEGTMIDSHALVGSCAQIGKRVHVSAAAQIGGVLEPIGAMPVIIEDDVFVGGNTGIYEGAIVKSRAVIASGVILTGSTKVYDLVNGTVISASKESPLVIPENAVVVSGSRPASSKFAKENGIQIYTPVIIKYRDDKTDASTVLEDSLR